MTDDDNKRLVGQQTEEMLEEIRTKVFERYTEKRGVETQESALHATLDALQEITDVPRGEIDKIAAEVQRKHLNLTTAPGDSVSKTIKRGIEDLSFERMRKKVESQRRGFVYQLIPYVAVNSALIYLNIISTSFPWAMFPLLGWGIGLVTHFMKGVVFPSRDFKKRIEIVKNQIHAILGENWPGYLTDSSDRNFNNVYRLIATECSQDLLEQFLKNADATLTEERVAQISTQLISLQNQYVKDSQRIKKGRKRYNKRNQEWH